MDRSIRKLARAGLVAAAIAWVLAGFAPGAGRAAAAAQAALPASLQFDLVTGGLTDPVFIGNAGDGSNRLFIVQQTGQIRIFKNGALLATPFLNIAGTAPGFTGVNGEQGLLSVAFDPDYATNGAFYITYTTTTGNATFPYTTTLARYTVSANPDQADGASGSVLLSIPKKYTNHNGGMLAFGPDGYLYMSMGDGGSGGDPDGNGQNLHTLLGKLLRLDVHTTPAPGQKYVIPSTNPFFGSSDANVKKEIWAYGLRNPWRFSFDRSTGDLFIGDVGQDTEEEVDFQAAGSAGGQNYGWNVLEGNLCYQPSTGCTQPAGYVAPVATYDHGTNDSYGCSISGGYVYRGSLYPSLTGVYFYGDYCSGKVLGLARSGGSWSHALIASTSFNITSFGQDESGELYLADYGGGRVYRIAAPCASTTVSIGGSALQSYCIDAGSVVQASYAGVQNGPLHVHSSASVVTSQRGTMGPYATFNEVPGYPNNQLTNHYWFPWYDSNHMITWVLVGNPSATQTATVTIKIAGQTVYTKAIPPLGNDTPYFPATESGPVEVTSNINIFTSQRVLMGYPDGAQSFDEVLGFPHNQLTSHYWFTWYDDKDMQTDIMLGNPSSSKTAKVTIKIHGAIMETASLPPRSTHRFTYAGVQDGPVEVLSSINVFASERSTFGASPYETFNEVMAYPHNQLTTSYWFPWYDFKNMITWVLVGNPSATKTAHVTIKIAGNIVYQNALPPGSRDTPVFPNVVNGPVQVTSDIPIFTSERVLKGYPGTGASFNEILGIANSRLTTDYWFTWYDDKDMTTELVIGRP